MKTHETKFKRFVSKLPVYEEKVQIALVCSLYLFTSFNFPFN